MWVFGCALDFDDKLPNPDTAKKIIKTKKKLIGNSFHRKGNYYGKKRNKAENVVEPNFMGPGSRTPRLEGETQRADLHEEANVKI